MADITRICLEPTPSWVPFGLVCVKPLMPVLGTHEGGHTWALPGAEPCDRMPTCTFIHHDQQAHPCGNRHWPGSPCEFCGKATPAEGGPCWDCWTPITIADLKAFAAEEGFDTEITLAPPSRQS